MQSPEPDTSEYAALLEHIGGAVRVSAPADPDAPANFPWARRAQAMTHTLLAMVVAAKRPTA